MLQFDYQRTLTRLIIDEPFYEKFARDRAATLAELVVADSVREQLAAVNLAEVDTFKRVVFSTREVMFAQVFGDVRARMTDGDWSTLLREFQRNVVVTDATNGADMVAFCDWLDRERPGTAGSALARYDLVLQLIGSLRHVPKPAGTARIAPGCHVLTTDHDLADVFEVEANDLWTIGLGSEVRYYALTGSNQTDDVEIAEIDRQTAHILTYLDRPRTIEEFAAALSVGETEALETLDALASSGLAEVAAE